MGADLLDAALEYLRRFGWSVFFTRGKEAAGKWKAFQNRRPTEQQLHRMFERPGLTGVAVILGEVSGDLWARDFDEAEAYPRWAEACRTWAEKLPTYQTGRGFQVLGYHPGVRTRDLGDGELRGAGGYSVLPPSLHPSGRRYVWVVGGPERRIEVTPEAAGLARPWYRDKTEPPSEQRDTGSEQRDRESEESEESEEVGGDTHEGRGRPPRLTLAEVVRRAIPQTEHQNHKSLFLLGRGVKALERAEGRGWSMTELEARAFMPWYERNEHLRPEQTREQYLAEFLLGYDLVRHPLGEGVMEATWAKAATLEPPPAARQFASPHLRRVVTWCYLLQSVAGDAPFYLSVRTLQSKLGLRSPQQASAILRRLVEAGILAEVEKGGRDTNKASRFRYLPALGE